VAALHEEAAAEAELEDTKAHVSPRGPSASSNAPSELMEACVCVCVSGFLKPMPSSSWG
jgi:hypothetical protein